MFRAFLLPSGLVPLALLLQGLAEQIVGSTVARAGGGRPAEQRFCRRTVAGFQRQPATLNYSIDEITLLAQQFIEQPPRFHLLASERKTAGEAEPCGRVIWPAAAELLELRPCFVP